MKGRQMRIKPSKRAVDGEAHSWKAKHLELCSEIDSAIKSINASVAALERLNAQRRLVNGSKTIPWELEHESLLEGIVEALAYPQRHSSIFSMPYRKLNPFR
jgi:hypothetical protein